MSEYQYPNKVPYNQSPNNPVEISNFGDIRIAAQRLGLSSDVFPVRATVRRNARVYDNRGYPDDSWHRRQSRG